VSSHIYNDKVCSSRWADGRVLLTNIRMPLPEHSLTISSLFQWSFSWAVFCGTAFLWNSSNIFISFYSVSRSLWS